MRICLTWISLGVLVFTASCSPGTGAGAQVDVLEQAAAEATAIVQQARATALVLQAQAQATAVVAQAIAQGNATDSMVAPTGNVIPIQPTQTSSAAEMSTSTPAEIQTATLSPGQVELLGVSYAAEGGYIMVSFRAPPAVAGKWYQGVVSVTDEATGTVYDEVPVVPVIGPLFARPVEMGQQGYFMLVNTPPGLPQDALVTVKMGDYIFEHIPVAQP